MADSQSSYVNPVVYGGVDAPFSMPDILKSGSNFSVDTRSPVSTTEAFAGSNANLQGIAADAYLNRDRVSYSDTAKAVASQWVGVKVWNAFNGPSNAPEDGFQVASPLDGLTFAPTPVEREFLNGARNTTNRAWRIEQLNRQRKADEAIADNPKVALFAELIDPTFFGLEGVGFLAGRAAKAYNATATAQRLAAGVAAGTATYAAGSLGQMSSATSDKEVIFNTLMMGGMGGLLYREGKLVPKDAAFPSQDLQATAQAINETPLPKPGADMVGPAEVFQAPRATNLDVPKVLGTAEAPTPVTYGKYPKQIPDYSPTMGISREDYLAMVEHPNVVGVSSVSDISRYSQGAREGYLKIAEDAKAVYLPSEDKVFLVKSNIRSGDDIKGILLHEVGVHMNGERVLGTEVFGKVLAELEDRALRGEAAAKAAYAAVPKDTPHHLVREEALGYFVEMNHSKTDNLISRLVAGVREKLRDLGLNLKYSEGDIMALVRKAYKNKSILSHDTAFPYVWHGSAVKGIDQLDTAYMGSGEGRQAFGWGHYVTSEKGTALDYRNKESMRRGIAPEDGGLYRVKLRGTVDDYLNLDSTAQSPRVAAALERLGVSGSGMDAYKALSAKLGSDQAASTALYSEGVLGSRFATGRSRMADVQSSNYVLFDNSVADMQARYSKQNPLQVKQSLAEKLESDNVAKGIALNLYKSASRFSDTAKNIMRDLIEDPVDMRGNSVVSQKMAIRADAHRIQSGLYDLTLDAMEARGFGMLKRALNPREAMRVQRQLERELTIELAGRDAGVVSTAAPEVVKMADKHVELMQHMLKEMQAADVAGAKGVKPSNGYFTRHWVADQIERIEGRLEDAGYTAAASKAAVVDLVAKSLRGIPDVQVAQDIAKALVDRAKRKGYFEDTAFSGSVGGGDATQIRDILEASGLPRDRVQRVMDTVMSAVDEAGKSPELKRRVDLDMTHSIQLPDGTSVSVVDMLDSNILSNTDRYVNSMSGRVALANKGLRTPSEIAAKRSEYLHSIANQTGRAEGAKYFDAILEDINGRPSGEAVPELMRTSQQLTQMVGLAGAGVWQITDYAKMMQTYGMGATVKYALKELPVFRSLLNDVNHSKTAATELNQVLTANVNYDLRMKPFLQRMEDNFDIQAGAELNIALNHHKQMVPYINGMKFVHGHQAKIAGNLVAQTFSKAASGDVKAIAMLERYGMEPHTIARIRQDIVTNGLDTAKWSDSTWRDVRGPLGKMMDEAVLKSRTGEVPYFAQFSALGKFIFTFRGFTLAAHNKLLAGTLGRDGYAGLSLLMLYQYPLAVAATATNNTIQGKKPLTTEQMLAKAVGQVGALGLYSEIWNMLSGETTRASSPGFIALDRMYQVGGAARAGVMASANDGFSLDQYGKLGGALLNTVPLVASFGPTKALAEQLKGN